MRSRTRRSKSACDFGLARGADLALVGAGRDFVRQAAVRATRAPRRRPTRCRCRGRRRRRRGRASSAALDERADGDVAVRSGARGSAFAPARAFDAAPAPFDGRSALTWTLSVCGYFVHVEINVALGRARPGCAAVGGVGRQAHQRPSSPAYKRHVASAASAAPGIPPG